MAAHPARFVESNLAIASERLAQALLRPKQSRLCRRKAQAMGLRERLLLDALQVALLNDYAVFGRDFGKVAQQTGIELIHRRAPLFFWRCKIVRQLDISFAASRLVSQCIAGYLNQPGAWIIDFTKPLPLAQRFDKHFLQQIVGGISVAQAVEEIVSH